MRAGAGTAYREEHAGSSARLTLRHHGGRRALRPSRLGRTSPFLLFLLFNEVIPVLGRYKVVLRLLLRNLHLDRDRDPRRTRRALLHLALAPRPLARTVNAAPRPCPAAATAPQERERDGEGEVARRCPGDAGEVRRRGRLVIGWSRGGGWTELGDVCCGMRHGQRLAVARVAAVAGAARGGRGRALGRGGPGAEGRLVRRTKRIAVKKSWLGSTCKLGWHPVKRVQASGEKARRTDARPGARGERKGAGKEGEGL